MRGEEVQTIYPYQPSLWVFSLSLNNILASPNILTDMQLLGSGIWCFYTFKQDPCYRPQMKLQKSIVCTPVSHSVHGGGEVYTSQADTPSTGQTHSPWQTTPPEMATAADSTHPTGMHSCLEESYPFMI